MDYYIHSLPKKITADVFDSAVIFAMKFLSIELDDLLIEFETLDPHDFGFCIYDEGEAVITIAQRLRSKDAIRTLFHEMVHVRQHIQGFLETDQVAKYAHVPYTELPWEQEAYALEEQMFVEFYKKGIF